LIAVADNPRARAAREQWRPGSTSRARLLAGQLIAAERRRVARIVMAHEGLAVAFARDMARRYPDAELDDLAQLARLGIAEAARRFDPSRGCKFSTYAWIWARAEVTNARPSLRGGPIQAPRRPTAPIPSVVSSFDAADHDDAAAPEPDDDGATCPIAAACRAEDRERVHLALGKLHPRDALVAELRFGINGAGRPHTLAEIAERLGGVTPERVRQIQERALAQLRQLLA
jgi:RNA polymerase sigma factor (sigma-70 family)